MDSVGGVVEMCKIYFFVSPREERKRLVNCKHEVYALIYKDIGQIDAHTLAVIVKKLEMQRLSSTLYLLLID